VIVTWAGESGRCAGLRRPSAQNLSVAAAETLSFNDQDYETDSSPLRLQKYFIYVRPSFLP